MRFALPRTAGHRVYSEGSDDAHGNPVQSWAAPVDVAALWWSPSSTEPLLAGHDRVSVDVVLVVDSALSVSPHDRFVLDSKEYEVLGEPEDYDHGPYSVPGRKPVHLGRLDG